MGNGKYGQAVFVVVSGGNRIVHATIARSVANRCLKELREAGCKAKVYPISLATLLAKDKSRSA